MESETSASSKNPRPLKTKADSGEGHIIAFNAPKSVGEVAGLLDVWHILIDYKWLVIAVTALFVAATTIAALLMTPI